MKNRIFLIEESLNEFAKRGRKPKIKKMRNIYTNPEFKDEQDIEPALGEPEEIEIDNINDPEIFDKIDASDMENGDEIEINDETDDDYAELKLTLRNELLIPEVDREYLEFSLKNDPEHTIISGVPMAELKKDNAFLFKGEDGGFKKIYVKDIMIEE